MRLWVPTFIWAFLHRRRSLSWISYLELCLANRFIKVNLAKHSLCSLRFTRISLAKQDWMDYFICWTWWEGIMREWVQAQVNELAKLLIFISISFPFCWVRNLKHLFEETFYSLTIFLIALHYRYWIQYPYHNWEFFLHYLKTSTQFIPLSRYLH